MRALARLVNRAVRPRRARARAGGAFVVLWWPSAGDPVPEVAGPYTAEHARAVRDAVRASQARGQDMAQAAPLTVDLVVGR